MTVQIKEIEHWVKQRMAQADPGHDWDHVLRVRRVAQKINSIEGGDQQIVDLAALLHDCADGKFFDEQKGLTEITQLLKSLDLSSHTITHVINIITHLSFSKGFAEQTFDSLEFRIIQDADRMDAIGAIGIARAFSYGALKNRLFYDPEQKPTIHQSPEAYRNSKGHTINHFYEKLLLLKDQMKTKQGRQMAEDRHKFTKQFLAQFYREWDGL